AYKMAQFQIEKAQAPFNGQSQTKVHLSCFKYGPDKYLTVNNGCSCVHVEKVKLETAAPSPTSIQAWFVIHLGNGNDEINIRSAEDRNKYLSVVDGQ
ncbi:hypothetical protein KI387_005000, partial [Taxus chinensis]